MVERSRRSVGATIGRRRGRVRRGRGRQPRRRHPPRQADKGGGYCVFNDVAVAARLMQAEWHRRHGAPCRGCAWR